MSQNFQTLAAVIARKLRPTLTFGVTLICLLGASGSVLAAPAVRPVVAPTKIELLTKLKAIQTRQSSELQEVDDAVKKRLTESTTISLKSLDSKLSDRRITKLGGQIDDLAKRRNEYSARRDFLSGLIFAFDTKWSGQPVAQFLEHTFLDMAVNDLSDTRGDGKLWKFLTYASIAVREVPETGDDVIAVLESYMTFANIIDPKTPAVFLANRSYTSGNLSYSAKPIPRDRVGDFVEKQLGKNAVDLNDAKRTAQKAPADIELRIPPMPAPSETDDASSTSGTSSNTDGPLEEPTSTPTTKIVLKKKPSTPVPRPIVNPTNGAAIPPAAPAVPGQKY